MNEDKSLRVGRENLTLRERTADMLRQAIVEDHRFPPGTRLKERELCDLLGVSRTSVREALRHLESERLIKMVPHKGPIVASLTVKDAESLYQVRAALEGLAGEMFAKNASGQQIKDLQQSAKVMASAADTVEPKEMLVIIEGFFQILFEGSQNEICTQFIQSLNARTSVFRRMSLSRPERSAPMMKEIAEMVDAAVARDGVALKQACIAHVEGACNAVMPLLRANEEPSA